MKNGSDRGLKTIARLRDIEERAAAERMNAARERLDRERRNLTSVRKYLDEYSSASADETTQSRLMIDRRRFRLKLEQTIENQQAVVARAESDAELARTRWTAARSERAAMERLVDRRRDAELRREIAADQKQSDEQALHASRREREGPKI